jgi:histidinol dehydrogenase
LLQRLDLRGVTGDLVAALSRPDAPDDEPLDAVREIIQTVRERGDRALLEFTERFDGCVIETLRVDESELRAALDAASPEFRAALEYARDEITAYHRAQRAPEVDCARGGIRIRELVLPVERAGCYVPGGRANYPSTVLMTTIPALVAGVKEVVLCVPPASDGRVSAPTLAAAALVGVREVYSVGGAQAIAAMAFGTETIRPVEVIYGPGNIYVALAKREVAGVVATDFAGPSEVVVIADAHTPAEFTAADLLAQSEHGPGGTAMVVAWDESVLDSVDGAIDDLLADTARRSEIEATLASGGRSVLVDDANQAMAVANAVAPEHLELLVDVPEVLLPMVRNAGAVFCGAWAPAVVGDYVAGVNHVLPTGRTARFASALRVDDFCRHVHVVDVDEAALRRVAPHVRAFAAVEGLAEHGRSVELRERAS